MSSPLTEDRVCYICDAVRTKRKLSDGTPVCKRCQTTHVKPQEATPAPKQKKEVAEKQAVKEEKKKKPEPETKNPCLDIDLDWDEGELDTLPGFGGFQTLFDPD